MMKHILDKATYIKFLETFKVSKNQRVFVHHNITEDLVIAEVKAVYSDSVLLTMPEDSEYFGQPDWKIKKTMIVGME